jgi:hypothetical protein
VLEQGEACPQPESRRISAGITDRFSAAQLFHNTFQQFPLFDFKNAAGSCFLTAMKGAFQLRLEFFGVGHVPRGQNSLGVLCDAHENSITSVNPVANNPRF